MHVLGMELDVSRKLKLTLSGFHHDFKGTIEKMGLFKYVNRKEFTHGFYSADLFHNGYRLKEKTFFPSHWSRKKVVGKILEAYNNCIQHGSERILCPDGTYKLEGRISEGIRIAMFVTKNAKITTAYPRLGS